MAGPYSAVGPATRPLRRALGLAGPLLLALASLALGGPLHAAAPATAVADAAAPADAAAKPLDPAQAAEMTAKCIRCHDDPELIDDDGKSVTLLAADYARSSHRKAECVECHTAATTVRHPRKLLGPVDPETCRSCHDDEMNSMAGSVHARPTTAKKPVKDCTSCHGPLHKAPRSSDPASPLSPVNQIGTCGDCHQEMMNGYESSEHARALLKAGLTEGAPSCSSCHGSHDIQSKKTAGAATHHAKVPQTCGSCHKGILQEWRESAHGTVWKEGSKNGKEGPVCTTCHTSHAIKRPDTAKVRDAVADECGNCHEDVYQSFHDSFHGKATSLENAQAAVCSDCHTPHHNLPASDPRSSINKANLAKTCGKCHDNVNAAFLTFDPHARPSDPKRNPYVYWIWVAMTTLLLGVFGFFGLHDLLWLQRALVGRLRGEFKAGHAAAGPYVRRFSSMQMWVHVTIVLSFLLLAATGLPLKFAEASWAPRLMALLGGAETAGVLHRLAAVVTFGYFAWHIGMLLHDVIVKKARGYLWGPNSMTPQPRDIADIWRMFKYFLYVGERPKFDRFAYWEKFDYLAVFWGVAIIGLSGLALWLPTLATRVLPGWALNAAYVMHSDEALLATGFIFMFHFFHTHLRPEAFPMDPVIFTGRMPLERFREERPLEYQRLVAEGRLETLYVEAPTATQLRRAYVFGFTAMAVGVALALLIFWALLSGLLH